MSVAPVDLTTALLRIAAKSLFGNFVRRGFDRLTGKCWTRQASEMDAVHSDWKKILQNKYSQGSANFYVSAGDLYSMGPLLTQIAATPLRERIKKVCIKRVSPEISTWLTKPPGGCAPIFCTHMRSTFEGHIANLKRIYGADNIEIIEWKTFPPLHGSLYRNHVNFASWHVNEFGLLSHVTAGTFMHQSKDDLAFTKLANLFRSGFEE